VRFADASDDATLRGGVLFCACESSLDEPRCQSTLWSRVGLIRRPVSTRLSRSRTAALRQVLYPAVSYWPRCARRSCMTTHHTVYYFVFGVIKLIASNSEISKGHPCSEDRFSHPVNPCLYPGFFPLTGQELKLNIRCICPDVGSNKRSTSRALSACFLKSYRLTW